MRTEMVLDWLLIVKSKDLWLFFVILPGRKTKFLVFLSVSSTNDLL